MTSVTPNGGDYSAHPWKIDVEVYIYDATPITDSKVDLYMKLIALTLRGEHCISYGCGDRGFSFWADDAVEPLLHAILNCLEEDGCIIDYPDWHYINDVGAEQN